MISSKFRPVGPEILYLSWFSERFLVLLCLDENNYFMFLVSFHDFGDNLTNLYIQQLWTSV
jgi:hypothetical protein